MNSIAQWHTKLYYPTKSIKGKEPPQWGHHSNLKFTPLSRKNFSFGFQKKKQQQQHRNRWNRGGHPPIKNRDASVTVRPGWKVIEEMDFPRLSKLSLPNVDDPKDLWVLHELVETVLKLFLDWKW